MEDITPNPRLRVLSCPDGSFVIVLDRMPNVDADAVASLDEGMAERLPKCGGILVFEMAVDMEAYYPYG